jgi:hypothetical protein
MILYISSVDVQLKKENSIRSSYANFQVKLLYLNFVFSQNRPHCQVHLNTMVRQDGDHP